MNPTVSTRRRLTRALCQSLCVSALALVALGTASSASAQIVTVSAAASLTNVIKELGPRFEASHPGVQVQFNFAASGVLIQQIAQGAPVDVFISADEDSLARGIKDRLLDGSARRDIASNQLVLIVPATGGVPVAGLADLNKPGVQRVAIGKLATVPVGRYTQQALQAAGLWTALEPRFVYGDSVRQVLDYVARGEVEAGFVYSTDAALMPGKVRQVGVVSGHDPVRYPAAPVSESRNPVLARGFISFLLESASQELLARAGFGKP